MRNKDDQVRASHPKCVSNASQVGGVIDSLVYMLLGVEVGKFDVI